MKTYGEIEKLYPFIKEDFYEYSQYSNNLIRMRNKNDPNIFCDLHCYGVSCDLYFNTAVRRIVFKRKINFFSDKNISYKNFCELNFHKDYIIEKTIVDSAIYRIKAINENLNLIVTTYTKDLQIYELPGSLYIYQNKKYYDNKEEAAVLIENTDGKLLEKHFIVDGKELSEFEFEVFKASK